MTYETALDAAKFLIANAEEVNQTPSINFFGGEPMLMWDSIIVPLTNWIRQEYNKPFQLSMTTNGTLLNEERIKFMKENNIGILLSIDGAKETQDYNRPYHNTTGSSFDTLEKILPLIVENFSTTFRMTTIPPTCHHVFENIQFASSLGFNSFFVIPNVFEEWPEDKKLVLKDEMTKYGDYYIECMRNGTHPIVFSTFENAFSDIKAINSAISNKQYRITPKCKACGKCGLGSSRFASIHPNGNLYGCQEMTSNEGEQSVFYIGNIYTGVEDERRTALMELYDNNPIIGSNCETCRYNRICDGGCVANNYMSTGSLSHLPKMYCWWKQIVLDEAIRVMQTLGNEGNETFRKKWVSIR